MKEHDFFWGEGLVRPKPTCTIHEYISPPLHDRDGMKNDERNSSLVHKACQMYITSLSTNKVVPQPGRNVFKALERLQRLLFYRIGTECKSLIQMRVPMKYWTHIHMPAEHIQCNDEYMILLKQKVSIFPRCTLTE